MSAIAIKFRPFFREPMLNGRKVMTCRTKKMGEPGDRFMAFLAEFELTHVMRMRLGFVASDCFQQEGCQSYQEFLEVWKGIHPTAGFDPEQIVWAHCFKEVT